MGGYILLGKRVADTGDGLDSLAVGMSLAAVVLAPPSSFRDPHQCLGVRRFADMAAGPLYRPAVDHDPYALDQLVLIQIRVKFALLLALLPVTATLIGVTVLRQIPTPLEITGIAWSSSRCC